MIVERPVEVERRWHAAATIHPQMLESCSRASLQFGGPTLRSLAVTSSIRREGRTSVALAMAAVQVRDYGRHPLLLEMDFDAPALSKRLHTDVSPGLAELIRGQASLEEVVQPLADGMTVVTAGAAGGAPARLIVELMDSTLLQDMTRQFDIVVADLPPLLGSTYGRLAADLFERTLLLVRAGVTPVSKIREAGASLRSEPLVLLNGTSTKIPRWVRRLSGT
jgi:Mrp family chromosome partitioning ATPase